MKLLPFFSLYYFPNLQKYLKRQYSLENIFLHNFLVSLNATKQILLSALIFTYVIVPQKKKLLLYFRKKFWKTILVKKIQ